MASYELACNLPGNEANMENMVRAADPEAVFGTRSADYRIEITVSGTKEGLTCRGWIGGRQTAEVTDREIGDPRYGMDAFAQRQKEMVRKSPVITPKNRPAGAAVGILTGVRPSKIYHYLRDLGFSPAMKEKWKTSLCLVESRPLGRGGRFRGLFPKGCGADQYLCGDSLLSDEMSLLFLCFYPLTTHAHLVEGFNRLAYEIEEIGKVLTRRSYPGHALHRGGTPTVLSRAQLGDLLADSPLLPLAELLEYTVEAGRPILWTGTN